MSGFFNMVHEQNTEIFPEAEQEVLEDGSIKLTMRVDSKRIDGHRHLVILAPGAERLKQTSLLRAIQKSRQWTDMLINGEAGNVTDLAEKLGYKPSYVTRILSLNNLAPDIVESILAGTEPEGMSIAKITAQPIPEDTFDGFNVSLIAPLDEGNPVPSCRNADGPYHQGQYVLTVDGFLVSDNVTVTSSDVVDLGFAYSDHNPVEMRFVLEK